MIGADDGNGGWRSQTFHLPLTRPLPEMPPVELPVQAPIEAPVQAPIEVPVETPAAVEQERRPLLKWSARRLWLSLPDVLRRPPIRFAQTVIDR